MQIGKYHPPVKGGMETVLGLIGAGLQARGHDLWSVAAAGGAAAASDDPAAARDDRHGRVIRCRSLATVASQPFTPSLPFELKRLFTEFRPEIVTLHWPNPLAAVALYCVRRYLPREARLTVWYHADITRQKLGAVLLRTLLNDLLDRAAGIAVSTASLRDRSSQLSARKDKVEVIPFGIDAAGWRLPTCPGVGPFLFVGRLVYYKGLELLLDAVESIPDARLEIVGDGPLWKTLIDRASAPGLQGRVRMHGELDDGDLRRVMVRCGALVLPSLRRSETFGLVQIEAMAAGLPVISTQLPTGVAEVNVHERTGLLVPPGDRASLAEAMSIVMRDCALARRWGEAGRARVQAHFNHVHMIESLERWYEALLHRQEEDA
ncbi:glycosyltransferase [bacterium]|nr:glycosyltransferase [bacterium]MBU1073953.1 glycosyltransferase [bacterium]MBU1676877.1 glycosyltransferase [bacterium]